MSEQKPKEPRPAADARLPMNVEHIGKLVDLMVANDLSRVELRDGDAHILLRRGPAWPTGAQCAPYLPPTAMPAAPTSLGAGAPVAAKPAAEESNEIFIRSPMVGTFYSAPDPESPPFVNVGTEVTPDTVVCLIEAMKVFNELKAEVSGRISRVLVKNAAAVEFDQPLFALTPA